MEVLPVLDKIQLTDQFIIERIEDNVTLNLPENPQEITDNPMFVVTGEDMYDFTMSLQTNFLAALTNDVAILEKKYRDLQDDWGASKLANEQNYDQHRTNLAEISNINYYNSKDIISNRNKFDFAKTEAYRVTRLYHIVKPTIHTSLLISGTSQLLSDGGYGLSERYEDATILRVMADDISSFNLLSERNFWGVFPLDLIDIIVKQRIDSDPDDPDQKVVEEVKSRVVYQVQLRYPDSDKLWDPYTSSRDAAYIDIPILHVGGDAGPIHFSTDNDTALPDGFLNNITDYAYGQFNLTPFVKTSHLTKVLNLYLNHIASMPVGIIIPYMSSSIHNDFGVWKVCDGSYTRAQADTDGYTDFVELCDEGGFGGVPNLKGRYVVGHGTDGKAYEYDIHDVNDAQRTARPKKGMVTTDPTGGHTHSITTEIGGAHAHYLGGNKYAGSGNDVRSSKGSNQKEGGDRNHYPSGGAPFTIKKSSSHTHSMHVGFEDYHTHPGFEGWDAENRSYSTSVKYMMKVAYPQDVLDMRVLLESLNLI